MCINSITRLTNEKCCLEKKVSSVCISQPMIKGSNSRFNLPISSYQYSNVYTYYPNGKCLQSTN